MKKIFFILIGVIAMFSVVIACSQDDSDLPGFENSGSKAIGFKTFLDKDVTRGVSTAPGNLRQNFWVYAYYDSIGDRSTNLLKPNFMYNQRVVFNDSTFSYAPTKYWPNTGDVNFYGWTPNTSDRLAVTNPTSATSIGYPTFNYTVNNIIANQEDLLVAAAEDLDGTSGTVNMPFTHALTKISIAARTLSDYASAGVTVKIMSVALSGIVQSGEFSFQKYTTNYVDSVWWTPTANDTITYKPYIGSNTGALIGYYGPDTYMQLPTSDQFPLMIPQHFGGTQAKLTIVYKVLYADGTATQTFTKVVPLSGTVTWHPNSFVTYVISISLNVVTFSGVVSDWNMNYRPVNIIPTDNE